MTECRSCGAPVVWAITTKTGKRVPLDTTPRPDGNVAIVGSSPQGVPIAHVLRRSDLDLARRYGDVLLLVSHFATCPDADDWRRHQHRTEAA